MKINKLEVARKITDELIKEIGISTVFMRLNKRKNVTMHLN